MQFHKGRLPHWQPENADYHVTWRLDGSPLAASDAGPRWLADHRIAQMVQDALLHGTEVRKKYVLDAWTIMPNHVHVVLAPKIPLREVLRWLKATTARRANRILGRRGEPFWQAESYDHWLCSEREWRNTVAYVEANPHSAGLVDWPFTSASRWVERRKTIAHATTVAPKTRPAPAMRR